MSPISIEWRLATAKEELTIVLVAKYRRATEGGDVGVGLVTQKIPGRR